MTFISVECATTNYFSITKTNVLDLLITLAQNDSVDSRKKIEVLISNFNFFCHTNKIILNQSERQIIKSCKVLINTPFKETSQIKTIQKTLITFSTSF